MSSRKVARFAVRCTVFATITTASAVALAGFSSIAMRTSGAPPYDGSIGEEPQMANRAGKTNRLGTLLPVALTSTDTQSFILASAPQSTDLDRFYDTVTSVAPMLPVPTAEPQADTATSGEPVTETATPVPLPALEPRREVAAVTPEKSAPIPEKHRRPPAPTAVSSMFDDGAIEGLRTRLRLTSDQAEYWPAVESALREVARTQLRHRGKMPNGGKIAIDVNSAEVQKLIWAAVPLIMRLRDDQKNEVRKLARIMGLEQVAAQI